MTNRTTMTPRQVMEAWTRCFNERDAEKLAALYHQDAENLQIALGKPLKGRAAILDDAREFFGNIPDNTTTLVNVVEAGEWIAIEWVGTGTFQPTGRIFEFRGCGFFHIVAGEIRTQRGYWDMLQWQRAIGVAKS